MTKQQVFIISAIAAVSFIIITSWQKKEVAKTYSVSYTAESWQAELDTLRMIQNVVGYPLTREVSDQYQSVIIRMQQRITSQIVPQIQQEHRNESIKLDSIKNKTHDK